MNSPESPLKTENDAKAYFQSMGCSHFHMSRENPERYSEYKSLNIPSGMEIEWKIESLKEKAGSIESIPTKELWAVHSRMEDLVQGLKSEQALEIIHQFTKRIEEKLPPRGKLLVAETINGRQALEYEPGLIFLAHRLKKKEIAQDLCTTAIKLASEAASKLPSDYERSERALDKTKAIARTLNLKPNMV